MVDKSAVFASEQIKSARDVAHMASRYRKKENMKYSDAVGIGPTIVSTTRLKISGHGIATMWSTTEYDSRYALTPYIFARRSFSTNGRSSANVVITFMAPKRDWLMTQKK